MHWPPTTIRKERADLHRYGKDVSRRGDYVYAAYSGDKLIVIAASASEARWKYKAAYYVERGVWPGES
jgi:hypothetical protein